MPERGLATAFKRSINITLKNVPDKVYLVPS
jgi:hypothetical protein